jgi:hypothetical protein
VAISESLFNRIPAAALPHHTATPCSRAAVVCPAPSLQQLHPADPKQLNVLVLVRDQNHVSFDFPKMFMICHSNNVTFEFFK